MHEEVRPPEEMVDTPEELETTAEPVEEGEKYDGGPIPPVTPPEE